MLSYLALRAPVAGYAAVPFTGFDPLSTGPYGKVSLLHTLTDSWAIEILKVFI
ncbi:hypothetical protein [Paenalcaligenes suwonensis]|uniref:hypothetical protein n=1 Tax=Paenalcaligenes suwonensis TaxID=1202713 RepID=UPI0014075972|nr:hypothetical protein [Paenalcaligenes suwonensis]NHC62826.1 hypothetical protein [Paenalcaligenes suwonensis]